MTVLKINSWNTTHYMITGLSASQYYDIQLRMFTSGGYGPWSLPAVVIRTDQGTMLCRGQWVAKKFFKNKRGFFLKFIWRFI